MVIFFLIIFAAIVYVASLVSAVYTMDDKEIAPGFLSLLLVLMPIVNTIICLKHTKFKEIFEKLFGETK